MLGIERDPLKLGQNRFARWFRRAAPKTDFVLFVNSASIATDATLDIIHGQGAATGVWLLDEVETLPVSRLDYRAFGYHASFSAHQASQLASGWGCDVSYVPQGYAPIGFVSRAASSGPLLLGAPYPSRRMAAEALVNAGFCVDLVGHTWGEYMDASPCVRLFDDVTLSESLALSSGGRICVNGHRTCVAGVSPRVFEIAAAGGVLVDDNPKSADFFEPGVEMITWREADEIPDWVSKLHREPELAIRLSKNAARRVVSEHIIDYRFASLLRSWGYK
ncbi:glycosyltransferase [Microbacterium horticulturae]|uniref:Glycosyltransferase n=1 Tax=Microbacterium horticulturae TaxID=3028316 RepID=A0ABY8BYB7_9MICO|nr:glycosyltransferase [Microbacterium sp. KACC 23027]WEG09190.1 glycosyltransferase [Microbacterium sp. KACC 23027]